MTKVGRLLPVGVAFLVAAIVAACGGGGGGAPTTPPPTAPGTLQVSTLSSKPEFVTGGNTLLQVTYPDGMNPSNVRVTLNGTDVSSSLTVGETANTLRGVVSGLTTNSALAAGSPNEVVASDRSGAAASGTLTVFNFPITGPVISGPHISPYECRTAQSGLGDPLDANCSAARKITYFYRASNNTFKPLADPTAARPADLVNTTTNDGVTVPYVVRVESGTINRGIYHIAMLDNPATGTPLPSTFKPAAGWNRKLVVIFGGGGGSSYNQGASPATSVLAHTELSRGFAYMNSSELVNQQHSNPTLQGETLMMLKEHFIKTIGIPKWTVGTGGSGGAIQQYLLAQLFPGLLDGLQPSASFPETFMPNVYECRLAASVFASDPGRWTTEKQVAIQGFNAGTCQSWDIAFASQLMRSDNAAGCAVTDPANVARVYHPVSNPTGNLFCTFFDTNTNLLGKDLAGRARRPADNVGVQYGLGALNSGKISKTEFLDLNQQIGGMDRDGYGPSVSASPAPGAPAARMVGDPDAIRLAWAGGFKNSFKGRGFEVPIVTLRPNASSVADIHDTTQDMIVRARLQRSFGTFAHQVILTSSAESSVAGFNYIATSLDIMNAWLDAIAADSAPASLDKVIRLKPAEAVDTCWDKSANKFIEIASMDNTAACNMIYPRFTTLRLEAGEPMVQDAVKCALKPVNQNNYNVTFSNAELMRLNQIFPDGVCDWSAPGVNQVSLKGTYQRLPLTE